MTKIINVEITNVSETVNFMATTIRKMLEDGYNCCIFKFEDYALKDITMFIEMLKEAKYRVITLFEDSFKDDRIIRTHYITVEFMG